MNPENEESISERNKVSEELDVKMKKMSDDFNAYSDQIIKTVDCVSEFNCTSIFRRKLFKARETACKEAFQECDNLREQSRKSADEFNEVFERFNLLMERLINRFENVSK